MPKILKQMDEKKIDETLIKVKITYVKEIVMNHVLGVEILNFHILVHCNVLQLKKQNTFYNALLAFILSRYSKPIILLNLSKNNIINRF